MAITRAELLYNFDRAVKALARAKVIEMRWRMLVAKTFNNVCIGTNTSDDGQVKMVAKVSISLDKDKAKIQQTMYKLVTAFSDRNFDNLISWEYKLNEPEYQALPDEAKRIIGDILTIKPATPQVKLTSEVE